MNKITYITSTTFITLLFSLAIFAKTGLSQSANGATHFDLNIKIAETRNKLDTKQKDYYKTLNEYNNIKSSIEDIKRVIAVSEKEAKAASNNMQNARNRLATAHKRQLEDPVIKVEPERAQYEKAINTYKNAVGLVHSKKRGLINAKGKAEFYYSQLKGIQSVYNALGDELAGLEFETLKRKFSVSKWVKARGESGFDGKTSDQCTNEARNKAIEEAKSQGAATFFSSKKIRINESIEYDKVVSHTEVIVSGERNIKVGTLGQRMTGCFYEMEVLVTGRISPEVKKYIKPKRLYLPEQEEESTLAWESVVDNSPKLPQVVKKIPRLRSKPDDTLSNNDVKAMLKKHNFYDSDWNKDGDFENKFELKVINGDKVVIDHATGLMWQQGGSSGYMVYGKVEGHISKLNHNHFAGYNNWRLPTIEELASLMERGKMNGDLHIAPVFSKTQRWCWSSDKRSSGPAWYAYFNRGHVHWLNVGGDDYVRAVRPGQ